MILLDTNIVIYLSKRLMQIDEVIRTKDERIGISIVTYMELLSYRFEDKKEEMFIKKFLAILDVIEVHVAIADKTVEIKRKRKIKLPDAIICATALHLNAQLITNDTNLQHVYQSFVKHSV